MVNTSPKLQDGALRALSREQREYLVEKLRKFSTGIFAAPSMHRVYALTEDAANVRKLCGEQFAVAGEAYVFQEPLRLERGGWLWLEYAVPAILSPENRELVERLCSELEANMQSQSTAKAGRRTGSRHAPRGFCLRRRKPEALKFYFTPASAEVLSLLAANALKLFELADAIAEASRHENLEEGLRPWL